MMKNVNSRPLIPCAVLLFLLLVGGMSKSQPNYFATLIGGGDLDVSWPHASLVTDPSGNIYVAATTRSSDFPVTDLAYDQDYNGGVSDVVVCKFSPDLNTLLASTFLGGAAIDALPAIVHDGNGHLIVAGQTNSRDFPVTTGSYSESNSGYYDFFIARLDDDLSTLLEATYLGGVYSETACDLVLDADQNIVLSGVTGSADFPVTPGAYDATQTTNRDVCLVKLTGDLSNLLAGTFFGPEAADGHPSIALDNSGNVVIVGTTTSASFPTTSGAYQETSGGSLEIYVSKFSPDLTSLLASTYFGSSSYEMAFGVAVDASENIYIVGHPGPGFPTTPGSYCPGFRGGVADAGVAKFDSDLTTLLASTFVGGSANDAGLGISLADDGSVIVSGYTSSTNFPVASRSIDGTPNGADDAYLVMLSSDLSTLIASTLVGGSSTEEGNAVLATPEGRLILAGSTSSGDFPATAGAYDESYNGKGTSGEFWGGDLFVSAMVFPQFTRITEGPHVSDGGTSSGVCWVDYDQDDDLDLYVSNQVGYYDGINFLYENQGDGTYVKRSDLLITQIATSTYSSSWADFDNDGDLDLAVANFRDDESMIYINDGAGGFTPASNGPMIEGPVGATNVSWVDYNLDGDLDLFLCNSTGPESGDYPPWENYLFQNIGGTLTKVGSGDIATRQRHSYGASWSDFDGDRDPDLVVPNNTPEATDLYLNEGDGSFTLHSSSVICASSANAGGGSWADYDNDGDMDLFLANFWPGPSFLFENTGGGAFVSVSGHGLGLTAGRAVGGVWGDYDNDGDQDIFIWLPAWDISTYEGHLFDNLGEGTFAPVGSAVLECDSCAAHGAAWGDHDRDGDLDLYIIRAELSGPPPTPTQPEYADNMLYQNNGNANYWITIKLTGTLSNRSAIGTKVRVRGTIGGTPVWQMRELMTQTGRVVQGPLECHFGLGDAPNVDSIKIEWPSGYVDILTEVNVNQFLTVVEGTTVDLDGDGLLGEDDNCPTKNNPGQEDSDGDGVGDACCCSRRVGDVNGEGDYPDEITLGDIMMLVDVKFISSDCGKLACLSEADVNQDGGGNPDCENHVTLADIMILVDFLFITGPQVATLPECL